jgi:hypothetical protein
MGWDEAEDDDVILDGDRSVGRIYKAAAMGFLGQCGTWSVNEASKTIRYRADGALLPFSQMLKG